MRLEMAYTFHGCHWNEEFFEIGKVQRMMDECPLELLNNQHGHLWRVELEVEGDTTKGIIVDYNDIQALINSLDFTFLPLHPITIGHLCRKYAVTEDVLLTMPEWGTAGKLEVVLAGITEAIIDIVHKPSVHHLEVTLHETGPEANRTVVNLSASTRVTFLTNPIEDPVEKEGMPVWY